VTVDPCGNLGSNDDQTLKQFARARGIAVVPSLFTLSKELNHQLLTDAADNFLAQIVAYTVAEDYAGFDLDLEDVEDGDREALSSFVARAAEALHAHGKLLTLAIPAKDRDVTSGWAGPYDYAALGASADLVTIMAYEYSGPWSGPGSVAPYGWVDRVLRFAISQMPRDKVLLGVAFYGYDWNTSASDRRAGTRPLGYPQALALAAHYGVDIGIDEATQSGTFIYEAAAGARPPAAPATARPGHQVTVRSPAPCELVVPPPTPPAAPAPPGGPRPAPEPGEMEAHEVWVEDARSVAARLGLAQRYGAGGIATWRLGQEDPGVWEAIQWWRGTVLPTE
jgi:spore germination protein YaaH